MVRGRGIMMGLLVTILAFAAGCGNRNRIDGSGTIEMDEIDVASLVGGRVIRMAVDEGDTVQAGDTLAVLQRGELSADVETQIAQENRARAQLRDVQAGPRAAERRAAQAELAGAKAEAQLAAIELARTEKLVAGQLVPQADLDRARTRHEAAVARQRAADEAVRLLAAGSRSQMIAAAREGVRAAAGQVASVRSQMNELVLTAPISGTVLLRNFESGEVAPPGIAVVTLGDASHLWIRVFVSVPELPSVHLGDAVELHVSGTKQTFRGTVTEIASEAEFTPRVALTEEEKANLVFGVKVRLDPSGGVLKAGLPAEARFVAAERK